MYPPCSKVGAYFYLILFILHPTSVTSVSQTPGRRSAHRPGTMQGHTFWWEDVVSPPPSCLLLFTILLSHFLLWILSHTAHCCPSDVCRSKTCWISVRRFVSCLSSRWVCPSEDGHGEEEADCQGRQRMALRHPLLYPLQGGVRPPGCSQIWRESSIEPLENQPAHCLKVFRMSWKRNWTGDGRDSKQQAKLVSGCQVLFI